MEDFTSLKENLVTRTDLVNYLEDLSQIEDLVYEKKAPLPVITEDIVSPPLQDLFEKRAQDMENTKKQTQFLKELEAYLEDYERLRLTVSFPASRDFLKELKSDLEEEIDSNFVVDFIVNPKIIGGAKIEYKGQFLDLSLESNLEAIFSSEF